MARHPAARPDADGGVGVFGGTFDPVHVGHLRTAFELRAALGLEEVRFIPCGQPPHRAPAVAPGALRLRMLAAALAGEPGFVADDRELRRPGPSYMVDTLAELRADLPGRPLCLLLGMDAFLGLPAWHRWEEIPALAHLVVAHRPGWDGRFDGPLAPVVATRRTAEPRDLRAAPAGRVLIRPVTPLNVASSAIRDLVKAGGDPRFLVTDAVRAIVLESGCYGAGAAGPDEAKEVRARAK